MDGAFIIVLFIAVAVVLALGYVIANKEGNGHVTDSSDAPWEDEDGS